MDRSIDYAAVGLMAGLEVHQQLATDHKLFCRCPAGVFTRDHDAEMLRHMRPTLSELGEYDGTALMEFKTRKKITYLLDRRNTCTYEMDDTPPFLVNQQAIDVAIEQCLMLSCDIIDEVHIARKQYLDGSIPTGFQRTAIVGVNGRLPFRGRELSIVQVSVEEDSCREVSDVGHHVVWRTDRLGMPLIETVTAPQLHTPDEVEEAILLIGRVCRSTRHVRTGIGASRQDVNVSVRGGRRVEIKGVPQAGWAPALVHGEASRQVGLLELRDELARRGLRAPDDVRVHHADVSDAVREGAPALLQREGWTRWMAERGMREGFERGDGEFSVRAVRMEGMAATLDWPTQPGFSFVQELEGRIRVIAGLDQPPILLHRHNWAEHGGDEQAWRGLEERMGCAQGDALVVVWGPARDTETATEEIRLRIVDALDGIPNETRQPFRDGHTDFERILPGPDRMYPDTDSPPTAVSRERVAGLQAALPEAPWERERRYAAAGVPQLTSHYLIRRGGADLVDRAVRRCEAAGAETAAVRRFCFFFGERLKGLRRAGVPVDAIPAARWDELVDAVRERPLLWDTVSPIVRAIASDPEKELASTLNELDLGAPPDDWRGELGDAIARRDGESRGLGTEARMRWHLGRSLRALRGRVAVDVVATAVKATLTPPGSALETSP